jgi:hypothetical protein
MANMWLKPIPKVHSFLNPESTEGGEARFSVVITVSLLTVVSPYSCTDFIIMVSDETRGSTWLISSGATGFDTLCTSFSWPGNDFLIALEEVDLDETAKKLVEADMALEVLLLPPFVSGNVSVGLVRVSLVLTSLSYCVAGV